MLIAAAPAFCQEKEKASSKTKHYSVDKNVADFPKDLDDLSKPENVYVLFNRALCAPDGKNFSKNLDKLNLPQNRGLGDKPVEKDYAKMLLSAQVLETYVFDGKQALVVAKLKRKDARNPFDLRWLENHGGQWLNTGNDRVDSAESAQKKWKESVKRWQNPEKPVTSIVKLLKTKDVKSHRVDMKVSEFSEKFDLSGPEGAYAASKQVIFSNRKDKIKQLDKLQFESMGMSDRERKHIEKEMDADALKMLKEKSVIYEVIKFGDDLAFVFGQRQWDEVYDCNMFRKKEDGLWYNVGNFQSSNAKDIAANIDKNIDQIKNPAEQVTSIKELLKTRDFESYRVDEKVGNFPEKKPDFSAPEHVYAAAWQLLFSNRKDKIKQLEKMQFDSKNKISDRERKELEGNVDEHWQKIGREKTVIYEVIRFGDDLAFVFGQRQWDEIYNCNMCRKKDDGLWYNVRNFQSLKAEDIAASIDKAAAELEKKKAKK
ncbi:hypothetical protein FACS189419_06220 [Planctomycetales bacterium]|nr:hypothetical protein FACS189419_06220 [Planctomycetales bacterium]